MLLRIQSKRILLEWTPCELELNNNCYKTYINYYTGYMSLVTIEWRSSSNSEGIIRHKYVYRIQVWLWHCNRMILKNSIDRRTRPNLRNLDTILLLSSRYVIRTLGSKMNAEFQPANEWPVFLARNVLSRIDSLNFSSLIKLQIHGWRIFFRWDRLWLLSYFLESRWGAIRWQTILSVKDILQYN